MYPTTWLHIKESLIETTCIRDSLLIGIPQPSHIVPAAAAAPARSRVRMTSAAAVSRSADFLGVYLSVLSVQEECEDEGDEEGDGVDDAKHP